MLNKMELNQLQSLSLDEVKGIKVEALKRKAELEAAKTKGGKDWTPQLQEELDNVVLYLVDIDDVIEEKATKVVEPAYTPDKGTEKMVHLQFVKGRRFNPMTGKEESKVITQLLTYSEWLLFKNNFKNLGYTIVKVLHDPYNQVHEYVTKI